MNFYDTAYEPSGSPYDELLRFCWRESQKGSLVVQEELGRSPNLENFLYQLRPAIVQQQTVEQWPGTRLVDGLAELYVFTTDKGALDLALTSSSRLFEWLQPHLPEDLAFYRSDGSVLMESISHERAARLFLDDDEYLRLPMSVRDLIEEADHG
jgi:hypothetical protein